TTKMSTLILYCSLSLLSSQSAVLYDLGQQQVIRVMVRSHNSEARQGQVVRALHPQYECLGRRVTLTIVLLFIVNVSMARPHARQRKSGISDIRLAELETQLSLNKMRSEPVAHGIFDPAKIGKRRFRQITSFPEPAEVSADDIVYVWIITKSAHPI
ncbi:uncharacterized protein LOC143257808, partial [Tachypleus tridentatus]|uniref:uncharacterized protein LOC143257808 n=1 Tax=Tachypleus tridentatus TaxID=6853 RepID=UPI003FCEEC76